MDAFKKRVHQRYQQIVQDRIDVFRDMITALSEDSKNDAKGSAGDKHETALSMMHIEQEKLTVKLREVIDQKAVLDKIARSENTSGKISLGSLAEANGKYFYLSAALPKIIIDDKTIFALSPQSPLGNLMIGKCAGDELTANGTNYLIARVL